MRLELRYVLFRSNYLRRLRYKIVIFQLHLWVGLLLTPPPPPHVYHFFSEFGFHKTYSFDETNARFYNKLLHLFSFP